MRVGAVTAICATNCCCRAAALLALEHLPLNSFTAALPKTPLAVFAFYFTIELLPIAAVTYAYRRLPPRRKQHYHETRLVDTYISNTFSGKAFEGGEAVKRHSEERECLSVAIRRRV